MASNQIFDDILLYLVLFKNPNKVCFSFCYIFFLYPFYNLCCADENSVDDVADVVNGDDDDNVNVNVKNLVNNHENHFNAVMPQIHQELKNDHTK